MDNVYGVDTQDSFDKEEDSDLPSSVEEEKLSMSGDEGKDERSGMGQQMRVEGQGGDAVSTVASSNLNPTISNNNDGGGGCSK